MNAVATQVDGRSARRERNAALLYDAATELLATQSFDDVSVDDVCSRAGVGRATFFRIYDTKTGLLRELNRRLASEATARLDVAGDVDVRTALGIISATIRDTWRHAGAGHLALVRAFMDSVPMSNPHAAHPELLALVTDVVRRGVERGELSAAAPVSLTAALALVYLSAAVAHSAGHDGVDIDQLSEVLLDQWYCGARGD